MEEPIRTYTPRLSSRQFVYGVLSVLLWGFIQFWIWDKFGHRTTGLVVYALLAVLFVVWYTGYRALFQIQSPILIYKNKVVVESKELQRNIVLLPANIERLTLQSVKGAKSITLLYKTPELLFPKDSEVPKYYAPKVHISLIIYFSLLCTGPRIPFKDIHTNNPAKIRAVYAALIKASEKRGYHGLIYAQFFDEPIEEIYADMKKALHQT